MLLILEIIDVFRALCPRTLFLARYQEERANTEILRDFPLFYLLLLHTQKTENHWCHYGVERNQWYEVAKKQPFFRHVSSFFVIIY